MFQGINVFYIVLIFLRKSNTGILNNMAGKPYENFVQPGMPWWKIVANILLSNVGLFFLCLLFAGLGAFFFIWIELPNEELRRLTKLEKNKDVDVAVEYLKKMFWSYAEGERYNYTNEKYLEEVKQDLMVLKDFVVDYNANYDYDTTSDWDYSWTFPKSLLFTLTIMTTIGYGHIAPKTPEGKMFCIGYSLFGIPLLLVFMAKIGDSMADITRSAYSRICCRWCRVRRRETESLMTNEKQFDKISKDQVGKELYMPTDMINVPIMVCLFIIGVFLLLGAFAFSIWEDWSLGAALYFCFISLTTIGFGDLIPRKSFMNPRKDFWSLTKMIFTVAYIIIGIALVSMCIQLMQQQIMAKISSLGTSFGLGSDDNEELVKVTKIERQHQTPVDMTGNELDFNSKRRKANTKINNDKQNKQDVFFEDEENPDKDFDSDF